METEWAGCNGLSGEHEGGHAWSTGDRKLGGYTGGCDVGCIQEADLGKWMPNTRTAVMGVMILTLSFTTGRCVLFQVEYRSIPDTPVRETWPFKYCHSATNSRKLRQ